MIIFKIEQCDNKIGGITPPINQQFQLVFQS